MADATNRTRAEIQAQIEELKRQLAEMPERKFQVGDEVCIKGRIAETDDTNIPYLITSSDDYSIWCTEADLTPAADLIPPEHERALAEARVDAQDAAIRLIDLSRDYGGVVVVAEHPTDGHTYRVTVERVDDDGTEPTPEPIGYINLYSDGEPWDSFYTTAEKARESAWQRAATVVPVYRHPAPQPLYESFSTRQQDPNIREMCAKFLGVEPTETSDKTVTELVSEVILKAKRGTATAVAPKGVVDSIKGKLKSLDRTCRHDPREPFMDCDSCRILGDITTALSRITELPEPSEWARDIAKTHHWFKNGSGLNFNTSEVCLDVAAALIERAALLESEAGHDHA